MGRPRTHGETLELLPSVSPKGLRGSEATVLVRHPADGSVVASANVAVYHAYRPSGYVRPFFFCQQCDRRCGRLYFAAGTLACRRCRGLTYASKRSSRIDRLAARARALRQRAGGGVNLADPPPSRPKGRWHREQRKRVLAMMIAEAKFFGALALRADQIAQETKPE